MDNILGLSCDRVSQAINRKPASNLYHAPKVAEALGLPFTHLVTLAFGLTPCPACETSRAFALLRSNHHNKWLARSGVGVPPTYAWVLENAPHVGVHAHWLIHLPARFVLPFQAELPRWMRAVAGDFTAPNVIHIEAAKFAVGAVRYMLKGTHPAYAPYYCGGDYEPQGEVVGKRSGTSVNLGQTAKQRLRAEGKYPKARPMWRPQAA